LPRNGAPQPALRLVEVVTDIPYVGPPAAPDHFARAHRALLRFLGQVADGIARVVKDVAERIASFLES
jgi:hypothetical protein